MAFTISAGEAKHLARIADKWPGKPQRLNRPKGGRPNKGLFVQAGPNRYRIDPDANGGLALLTSTGKVPSWALAIERRS